MQSCLVQSQQLPRRTTNCVDLSKPPRRPRRPSPFQPATSDQARPQEKKSAPGETCICSNILRIRPLRRTSRDRAESTSHAFSPRPSVTHHICACTPSDVPSISHPTRSCQRGKVALPACQPCIDPAPPELGLVRSTQHLEIPLYLVYTLHGLGSQSRRVALRTSPGI